VLKADKRPWYWEIETAMIEKDRMTFRKNAAARELESLKPEDPTKAREALRGIIERATERLTSKAEAHRERARAMAALAPDLLAFDDGPEGERLRRYELATGRGMARSLDSLRKHRREAERNGRSTPAGMTRAGAETGAAFEIDTAALPGAIDATGPIDGAGPIAENGMIHPVGAIREANPTNEANSGRENVTNEANFAGEAHRGDREEIKTVEDRADRMDCADRRDDLEFDRDAVSKWMSEGVARMRLLREEATRKLNEQCKWKYDTQRCRFFTASGTSDRLVHAGMSRSCGASRDP